MEDQFEKFAAWIDANTVEKFPMSTFPKPDPDCWTFMRNGSWVTVKKQAVPEEFQALLVNTPAEA